MEYSRGLASRLRVTKRMMKPERTKNMGTARSPHMDCSFHPIPKTFFPEWLATTPIAAAKRTMSSRMDALSESW